MSDARTTPLEIPDRRGLRGDTTSEVGPLPDTKKADTKPPARNIPVMARVAPANRPSTYRVFGEYETWAEAAAVVDALRGDPHYAWAYIPDEYAGRAE